MMPSLLAAALLAAQPAAPPPPSQLGEIRMHLFYEATGRLSRDISPPNDFSGWNTIIGEGSAEEYADDLVVVVEVRTSGHHFLETPLRIVARGRNNRIIAQRRFATTLTSGAGRAYRALWLNDVGCEGRVVVTASYGSQSRSETLSLDCGE